MKTKQTTIASLKFILVFTLFINLFGCKKETKNLQLNNNIKKIVNQLTTKEKAKLAVGMGMYVPGLPDGILPPLDEEDKGIAPKVPGTSGRTHAIDRLGIPSLVLADGPAGIHFLDYSDNKKKYATAIPIGTLLASTWDTIMAKKAGGILGNEAKEYGIDIMLTPAFNIQRNPLAGRNFEYYSEDPLLSGNIAAALTNGIQQHGIGTSFKHFVANNAEKNRMKLNTFVNERALREIYLKGFEIAVKKAKPWTVMTSYNLVNDEYTSESKKLITDILRNEWGFKGVVMSDWFAGKNVVKSLNAGNDIQMPGRPDQTKDLIEAANNDASTVKDLDATAARILKLITKSSTFNKYEYSNSPDLKKNAKTSRMIASEGMILLKNNKVLPLKKTAKIALLGNASYDMIAGGTGSGDVVKKYNISIEEGFLNQNYPLEKSISDTYNKYIKEEKDKLPKETFLNVFNPLFISEMPIDANLIAAASINADVVIYTIGRRSGESKDRAIKDDFNLTSIEQETIKKLSTKLHKQNKKLVVILNVGGVIETASWRSYADAILMAWQPGMEGGNAVADIISGNVNPSGKLTMTFPVKYDDVPSANSFPGKQLPLPKGEKLDPVMPTYPAEVTYEDGIFVGYRYYNTNNINTAYEFGYGLSYTCFEYNDITINQTQFKNEIEVSVSIKNTGKYAGKEVVQMYITAPSEQLKKPSLELKGFAKTKVLEPGKSEVITFKINKQALVSFDENKKSWVAEPGTYQIKIGASSLDIKQKTNFNLEQEIAFK